MRISDPRHPHHHLRQTMLELRRTVKPGDIFRLAIDAVPVAAEAIRWITKPGVGTWLEYKILKTGEIRTFSWMQPVGVSEVQLVDTSKDGLDFHSLMALRSTVRRFATIASNERARRIQAEAIGAETSKTLIVTKQSLYLALSEIAKNKVLQTAALVSKKTKTPICKIIR